MDLIVWRHAQAHDLQDGEDDMDRRLTSRGLKDADQVAQWLNRNLPADSGVLASPATRCQQTVRALARTYRTCPELAPGASAGTILALTQWPAATRPMLVVGHQPSLGAVVALLMGLPGGSVSVRKGGMWWLRHRLQAGQARLVVHAVINPGLDLGQGPG